LCRSQWPPEAANHQSAQAKSIVDTREQSGIPWSPHRTHPARHEGDLLLPNTKLVRKPFLKADLSRVIREALDGKRTSSG
jgi:hypothetical protein